MEIEIACKNCAYYGPCKDIYPCDDFHLDEYTYAEKYYMSDLHMRENEYQDYIDEMSGNA